MELTLLVALVGAGGVVLGSILGFFGTWLTNHYGLRVQREQWAREEKRAREEAEERRQASERDFQRREREHLKENYGICVRHVSALARYVLEDSLSPHWLQPFLDDLRQAEDALFRLLVAYPAKDQSEFKECMTSYKYLVQNVQNARTNEPPIDSTIKNARALRQQLILLSQKDPRLQ